MSLMWVCGKIISYWVYDKTYKTLVYRVPNMSDRFKELAKQTMKENEDKYVVMSKADPDS